MEFLKLYVILGCCSLCACASLQQFSARANANRRNCTRCRPDSSFKLGLAEKRRINIIRNQIITNLGLDTKIPGVGSSHKGSSSLSSGKSKKPRLSDTLVKDASVPKQTPSVSPQETTEIVSFSDEKNGLQKKGVLTFSIDMNNNQGPLEATGAHLFILLRKRRRKSRKGKRITLQIMNIADNSSSYEFFTIVRTRVKKTRWQKISLPVTLIQALVDSNSKVLQLRVICKRCGKSVKPVLRRGRNRKRPKRTKKKSKGRRKRRRRVKNKKKKLRNGNTRNRKSIRPFLVISSRYKY